MVSLSWSQALAWRMRRQLLDPVGTESVAGVVRRLGAVAAQPDTAAALAIRARRQRSRSGEVARALAEGRIIKTFAFRGATHLVTPEEGGAYLALRAASRMWERASWQSYYGLTPSDWPLLRAAVREALGDGPMTRAELGAAVTAHPRFRHLGFAFADGAVTLLKPLAWQGDMSFGPPRDGRATYQRLDGNPRWAGVPELDVAGPRAVEAYFRAYGPATPDRVQYWLGEGLGAGRKRIRSWLAALGERLAAVDIDGESTYVLREDLDDAGTRAVEHYFRAYGPATPDRLHYWLGEGLGAGRKRITGWIAGLGDRLATVDVDGQQAHVRREDLDELTATAPSTAVRLLPAYDQWVLGPGTADAHIVPPAERTPISRGANIVIVGGVVSGTWSLSGEKVSVAWFGEAGRPMRDSLAEEVVRLGAILDRPLRPAAEPA